MLKGNAPHRQRTFLSSILVSFAYAIQALAGNDLFIDVEIVFYLIVSYWVNNDWMFEVALLNKVLS
jgi:hypothetical protein